MSHSNDWGPFSLCDRVALVTGGAAGIGLGITRVLQASGAQVVVAARRADGQAILDREAPGATFIACDLAEPGAAAILFAQAEAVHGRIDVLVTNAGAIDARLALEIDEKFCDRQYAVNFRSTVMLIQAFARAAIATGRKGKVNAWPSTGRRRARSTAW
jgi:2-dehydro-3-deoxy-D-gluconate 5-dehydrogenase